MDFDEDDGDFGESQLVGGWPTPLKIPWKKKNIKSLRNPMKNQHFSSIIHHEATIEPTWLVVLTSGKLLHNYGKIHHF